MTQKQFPVVFAGHGSPMNAIENSRFRDGWRAMGARLGKPDAILAVSAHWPTRGQRVGAAAQNRQIFDMYGFPRELYEVAYAPAGSPALAARVCALLGEGAAPDESWGVDHGVWSVLCNLYPDADVPVVPLSIDLSRTPRQLFALGQRLLPLRQEGVMIFASGNVVHNLRLVDWDSAGGAPWAERFDAFVRDSILGGRPQDVLDAARLAPDWAKAVPTPEHFLPLAVALGAAGGDSRPEVWNEGCELGSMSMTSYLL